jgi:hypothetical protein
MMKNKLYALLLKTGDAELKAVENLKIDLDEIFPIIELTRGRRSKNDKIGYIEKRLSKIKEVFKNCHICIDLTTNSSLSNEEIDNLYSYVNGYQNWFDFLVSLKEENCFNSITPTILVNTDDPNVEQNLLFQVDKLVSEFDSIVYRNSLADDACYEDIELIKNSILSSKCKFYFIIDCEYIAPGGWVSFAEKAESRIRKVRAIIDKTQFIIVSTSFPNNVAEIGKVDQDTFGLIEIALHREVSQKMSPLKILYGDYGSINPIRNDEVIMSRGWVPRIDVALPMEIFYYRQKRGKEGVYSDTYYIIAINIVRDRRFPKDFKSNWGIRQIINCADGYSPGSTPSFWISVRMNTHIEQQITRLKSMA